MKDYNETIFDLQSKIEKKLNTIPDNKRADLKEIIKSNNILKSGKSLDYHLLQQLVDWLQSTAIAKYN